MTVTRPVVFAAHGEETNTLITDESGTVWTVPAGDLRSYVLPLMEAHRLYQQHWPGTEIIWAGDFNASVLFDKPSRRYKFQDFVGELKADGILSLYHEQFACEHGQEPHKTFFLYARETRGHHIDYLFASSGFRQSGCSINPGSFAEWATRSDHVPIICDFTT